MNRMVKNLARALCVGWLVTFSVASAAVDRGILPQSGAFVVGGIGQEEIAQLNAERNNYSFWAITAVKGSGEHLADVRMQISDRSKRVVFDLVLSGPWLLIDLPPGIYEVEATYNGETHAKTTTIRAGGHHQAVFYFNVPHEAPSGAKR